MRAKELQDKLDAASVAYYEGQPIMSDAEYDALRGELARLAPGSVHLAQVGAPTKSGVWPEAYHTRPMGSLLKVNEPGEYLTWAAKYTSGIVHWSEKLDGFSVNLEYEDGVFARAITRGDGIKGENISPNVIKMQGVPKVLPVEGNASVRCELIIHIADWKTHFPDKANPRNCLGLVRSLKGKGTEHVCAYALDVQIDGVKFAGETEKTRWLVAAGFRVPIWGVTEAKEVLPIMEEYATKIRASLPYEIDGLVIRDNDVAAAEAYGDVDGRPRAHRAYKFKSLAEVTTLEEVVWQTGRTGVISPVAIVTPVYIGGVTVSNVYVNNLDEINRFALKRGSRVLVARQNDVIPKIVQCVSSQAGDTSDFAQPSHCPSCNSPTTFDGVRVYCSNDTNCPAQCLKLITKYLKTLDVKGLGDRILLALIEAGKVSSPADLYRLAPEDFANIQGQSVKTGQKYLNELFKKSTDVPLETFVEALAMEGFGSRAKDLLDTFPTLADMRAAKYEDLRQIEGFGEHVATCVVEGFKARSALIDELVAVVTIAAPKAKIEGGPMSGKTFCFTGFRDAALEARIITLGGTIASGVSKKLNYLVMATKDSSSTKAKKAKEYGTTVLGKDELVQLLQ
jgi:DNA ligase (NAD+)